MSSIRRPIDDYRDQNSLICIPQEMVIENVRLAAAYIPFQYLCDLFNPHETLVNGTAFPELFSPFNQKDKRFNACNFSDS